MPCLSLTQPAALELGDIGARVVPQLSHLVHLLQESSLSHADAVDHAENPVFMRMLECLPADEYGAVCRWLVTVMQPHRSSRATAETASDSRRQLCSVAGSAAGL